MANRYPKIHAYIFPLILISSIILGGLMGSFFSQKAQMLKPIGDIFINLIFTMIVPLLFFSVASAIAKSGSVGRLRRILSCMAIVFLIMSIVSAIYGLLIVKLFPPAQGVYLPLKIAGQEHLPNIASQIVGIFTVSEFAKLLSHEHMLALIMFSIITGLAVTMTGDEGKPFAKLLQSGELIFMQAFSIIMYFAPFGFFAYFAVLVSELGSQLIEIYFRIAVLYYLAALIYFVIAYTGFAYLAGNMAGIKLFWKNVLIPASTAIATCSSAASIPVNLIAALRMGVPAEIYETTLPLGAFIHKDGSVIGGVFKIAFLFGIFHLSFSGLSVLSLAFFISILVGTVMGAIPSGGMLGELLILTVYGFPPSVLIAVAAISIIIDPPATLLNVTGNTVSSLMITRLVHRKRLVKCADSKELARIN